MLIWTKTMELLALQAQKNLQMQSFPGNILWFLLYMKVATIPYQYHIWVNALRKYSGRLTQAGEQKYEWACCLMLLQVDEFDRIARAILHFQCGFGYV